MFLKDLKEDSQKMLFLDLAILIMMAEGNKETTSQHIKDIDFGAKGYIFWQNIEEKEVNILIEYVEEIGAKEDHTSGFYNNYGQQDILNQLSTSFGSFCLKNALENQTNLVLEEYSKLEEFKKEVIQEIFLSGEDILNINSEMIQKFMLINPRVKQDILIRTADSVFKYRKDNLGNFNNKEKKIILFELIGAGYSSGYFGNDEKILFLNICELLEIESEYIEEFLDVSKQLFIINKELVDLINE